MTPPDCTEYANIIINFFHEWQTLTAGFLALISAWWTIQHLRTQIDLTIKEQKITPLVHSAQKISNTLRELLLKEHSYELWLDDYLRDLGWAKDNLERQGSNPLIITNHSKGKSLTVKNSSVFSIVERYIKEKGAAAAQKIIIDDNALLLKHEIDTFNAQLSYLIVIIQKLNELKYDPLLIRFTLSEFHSAACILKKINVLHNDTIIHMGFLMSLVQQEHTMLNEPKNKFCEEINKANILSHKIRPKDISDDIKIQHHPETFLSTFTIKLISGEELTRDDNGDWSLINYTN